ncbi:MAG TPA: hypothetical protein VFP55_09635 [Solirubrobacteraceae bacterium]|nr:hypothetical protein [Solirubrobacteraceae bacterium]
MTTTTILNSILAVGVIVMVVTPLVWAILTQRRDHSRQTITQTTTSHPAGRPHRATRRRRYTAAAGRA